MATVNWTKEQLASTKAGQSLFGETSDEFVHEIISLRKQNPGKKKDEAVLSLKKQAENYLKENKHLGIYISGNVASSKNSKEIGTYKKYDANHVLQTHHILRNSAVTERYKAQTKPQWVNNRERFLKMSNGLKMPLLIELTFIRDTLRRFDLINGAQIIFDLMAEYGYIPDDESCYLVPVFNPKVYYSKENTGILIKVLGANELEYAF